MKTADKNRYFIDLDEFAIDFRLNILESVEIAEGFTGTESNFAFAVVGVWLRDVTGEYLIIDAFRPGNFLEVIMAFQERMTAPHDATLLKRIFPLGGWCEWMSGYWRRLQEDRNLESDEIDYEESIPLSFMESRIGHIAVYLYDQSQIIEIGTRGFADKSPHWVWSRFDADYVLKNLRHIYSEMSKDIQGQVARRKGE